MEVVDPGHMYILRELDSGSFVIPQILTFVKREGEGYPGNDGSHPGTTTQEVLRALIDRTQYVHRQIPHWSNLVVLASLREAIVLLESRAAERHGRIFPSYDPNFIEMVPVCAKCGHVGCEGDCH